MIIFANIKEFRMPCLYLSSPLPSTAHPTYITPLPAFTLTYPPSLAHPPALPQVFTHVLMCCPSSDTRVTTYSLSIGHSAESVDCSLEAEGAQTLALSRRVTIMRVVSMRLYMK